MKTATRKPKKKNQQVIHLNPDTEQTNTKAVIGSKTIGNNQLTGKTNFLEMALAQGAPIETVERLVALYREEQQDRARKAFHEAMTHLQENLPTIRKNKKGYEGYQYADIEQIVAAIRKPVADHGFTYRFEYKDIVPAEGVDHTTVIPQMIEALQKFTQDQRLKKDWLENTLAKILSGREIEVTCVVTHKDGHSERTKMSGPEDYSGFKNLIQSRGSSVSYLERYTLKGSFGIVTVDSDLDGRTPGKQQEKEKVDEGKPKLTTEQFNTIFKRIYPGKEDLLKITKESFTLTEKQLGGLESADALRLKKIADEQAK